MGDNGSSTNRVAVKFKKKTGQARTRDDPPSATQTHPKLCMHCREVVREAEHVSWLNDGHMPFKFLNSGCVVAEKYGSMLVSFWRRQSKPMPVNVEQHELGIPVFAIKHWLICISLAPHWLVAVLAATLQDHTNKDRAHAVDSHNAKRRDAFKKRQLVRSRNGYVAKPRRTYVALIHKLQ